MLNIFFISPQRATVQLARYVISILVTVAIPVIQHVKYAHPTIYKLLMDVSTAGPARNDYLREWKNYLVTTPQVVGAKELQLRNRREGSTKLKRI
jgi:hypothetical protein